MSGVERTESHRQFDGYTHFFSHQSQACRAPMRFAAYVPPQAESRKLPALYWLSGLTCAPEIFMTEAQAQSLAKKHGLILVVPDTSPRDTGIAGEDDSYDLGSGAGFYVDATEPKWAAHYQMDSYVTRELRAVAEAQLPIDPSRRAISGHSMGGHGALVLGLRNPELYRSISAFAPICHPSQAPWGIQAFTEYLGADRKRWAEYDAVELLRAGRGGRAPILVDQGTEDEFLAEQLGLEHLEEAARAASVPVMIRERPGYDHSYYFISTYLDEHLAFHAAELKA